MANKIEIDWELVDSLCEIQCTATEIASVTKISIDTYLRRSKELHNCTFAEYIKKQSEVGKASLRRMQWKKANEGNATMLIWLGKQILGQKEPKQQEEPNREEQDINLNDMPI